MTLDYAIAVVAVGTAVIGGLVFHRMSGFAPAASLFFCVIMFVAWFSGTAPGIVATVLTILAFDYFFLPPFYSFALPLKDVPQLFVFAIGALFVVASVRGAAPVGRRAEAGARRAKGRSAAPRTGQ